jgi:hypothetical protein
VTTAVALQTPSLVFAGSINLLGAIDPTYGYRFRVLGDDWQPGDPEAIFTSIQSQLMDGDLERIDRFGNRTATIPFVIDAPNSAAPGDAIPRAQALIENACPDVLAPNYAWTTLAWTSPLAGAQTSVYEVVTAKVDKHFDDAMEMLAGERYFTLTIHARPFVRPVNPVTISAQAVVGSTTTSVDDGSSTTNWSLLTAQPSNGTNLITNPSFENTSVGWAAGSGTSSITPSKDVAAAGSYSLKVTPDNTATSSYAVSAPIAVTAGTTYSSIASLWMPSGAGYGAAVQHRLQWYSDSGGTTQIGSAVVSPNGSSPGLNQLSLTGTAPAGAVSARLLPNFGDPSNALTTWWLDATALTLSSWKGGYFDGSFPTSAAVTYAWTGAADASTSTATVTARSIASVSGMVKGTFYATQGAAALRRTGAVNMSSLPYMRITGNVQFNGAADSNFAITVADNGTTVTLISSSINPATGDFSILLNRPAGFATSIDINATHAGATSVNDVITLAVDQISITDNPYGSAAVQTQTITVGGSQRTEVSLLLRGQDGPGTTAVQLGNEVLVCTTAKGADGRAAFGDARALAQRAGTTDATAVSGSYDTLGTTAGPTAFTFPASKLLPGNYLVFARIKAPSAVTADMLSFRAYANSATTVSPYPSDPPVTGWKTAPFTAVASGAVWPQVNTNTWTMIPLGMLRLPPASLQDNAANITINIAKGTTAVTLDDLFLCNADVSQVSLMVTSNGGGSYSTVRLDAATVTSPQALAWVGAAPGTNLYTSGTFDSTTDSWASGGSVTATLARTTSSPTPHDGAGELQITWGAGAAGTGIAQGPNLTGLASGSTVTVGAWVQSASGQPTVQLAADDGSGGSAVTSAASTANDTWQFLSVTYTVPPSGICRPRIINGSTATAGQIAYVDTVTIKTTTDILIADATRWFGEQHQAQPGLVEIDTVTPGCTTTRVSATYYLHFAHDVAAA